MMYSCWTSCYLPDVQLKSPLKIAATLTLEQLRAHSIFRAVGNIDRRISRNSLYSFRLELLSNQSYNSR
jgi:hypothetical protein